MKTRKGFTLIELLVVISIIGMLAGMLLPAVNSAREAGRRTTCVNNQHNLVLAMQQYQGQKGRLPSFRQPQAVSNDADMTGSYFTANWIMLLFPYLEQAPLWDELTRGGELTRGSIIGPAAAVANAYNNDGGLVLPFLHCKSAGTQQTCGNSYVVNCGFNDGVSSLGVETTNDYSYPKNNTDGGNYVDLLLHEASVFNAIDKNKANGAFLDGLCDENRGLTEGDFTDGMSSTVLISENVAVATAEAGSFARGMGGMWGTEEYELGFCWPASSADDNGNYWNFKTNSNNPFSTVACTSYQSGISDSDKYVPSKMNQCYREATMSGWLTARPSSNHPGIAVMALADGSTRSVNDSIEAEVYFRLMTTNDKKANVVFNDGTLNLGALGGD